MQKHAEPLPARDKGMSSCDVYAKIHAMSGTCTQSVTILYALIFGAGEACVRFDFWSIMSAFGAFMLIVVLLQWQARRLWARLTGSGNAKPAASRSDLAQPYQDNPRYRDSAIRSTRR